MGPSGRRTRPIHQLHIQHFFGPTAFYPTIRSSYEPSCMGEHYEGDAILDLILKSDIDFPDIHRLPPNHDWRSSDG